MKRDWNVIKGIMLRIESGEDKKVVYLDRELIDGHLLLLKDMDLIDADIVYVGSSRPTQFYFGNNKRLTTKGHDFLDAARIDEVWKEFLKLPAARADDIYELVLLHRTSVQLEAACEAELRGDWRQLARPGYEEPVSQVSADAVPREFPVAREVDMGSESNLGGYDPMLIPGFLGGK